MQGYRQYCPVALAAEVLARRWTPLVLRELLLGSVRFNEIHRGVCRMSRSLLSTRLDELQGAGILERRLVDGHPEYHLTEAGRELRPVIMKMGAWGKRWLKADLTQEHLDAAHLMWDVQRGIVREALPGHRVVVCFHFPDAEEGYRRFWLVLDDELVDLCLDDPGYEADLLFATDIRTMVEIWLGDLDLPRAVGEGLVRLRGSRELRRRLPDWLGLSPLAGIRPVR
ncbi:MAG: helix-turn-helix domain-containing protein [Gemmatimonadota bacterium]|jgi:DNA-binding HxlR family transcriptional regulator